MLIGIRNPWCWQYRLTNRRVVMENPFGGEIKSVALDRFDAIDIVVEPGQAWFKAGDLVFRQGQVETFRIWGVPRPETFRQTCLKGRNSFVGVQQARGGGRGLRYLFRALLSFLERRKSLLAGEFCPTKNFLFFGEALFGRYRPTSSPQVVGGP